MSVSQKLLKKQQLEQALSKNNNRNNKTTGLLKIGCFLTQLKKYLKKYREIAKITSEKPPLEIQSIQK